ncbi:MAG: tRNA uridine-5-carboxymethylaminomethyl(34) synthesis GTPase MnmE [Deltaproteobacteria bacterium]|nr:tRNA uridine-5-carboxymethylaminomethyl(34) synthesis GTPase MnmE [Deltaproteobacteria bacterium]
MLTNRDTICAIATPPGHGGIGVVRISGSKSRDILAAVWRGKIAPAKFESHRLYLGEIYAPLDCSERVTNSIVTREGQARRRNGVYCTIDHAMVVWMQAPRSYTGDDVVEISAHGSPVILRKIVEACLVAGARLAEPGEFTQRAFLAGKLDLAQAEAVADLIHATSDQAVRAAEDQLAGRLSHEVKMLHDEILQLRTFVEATLDFPEEGIAMIEREGIVPHLAALRERIENLAATFSRGRLIRDGIRVAIVGRPNVGKSSLLNRLAGSERAIVHSTPGTTRDIVEVTVMIEGQSYHLADTAGLREGEHDIERIGIERTRQAMANADLLLVVLDGSEILSSEDDKLLTETATHPRIVCFNKSDLTRKHQVLSGIRISARTGDGMETLFSTLREKTAIVPTEGSTAVITNIRHKEALDESTAELQKASDAIARRDPIECVAHFLKRSQDVLGKITGAVTNEDLLDRVFSQFCIGK